MADLAGVFAATVTPFDSNSGEVDHDWIRKHLDYLRAHGCDGVVPLGTNGEGPSLSLAERKAVIDTVLDAADGLAVVPGTGSASLPEAIELTRYALRAGADAALVVPPFYYKNVPLDGLLRYYRRLCDAALEPGQEIFLYHFPRMSAVPIDDGLIAGLHHTHPGCVGGVKDSSGDLESVGHWFFHFPWLRVFAGSDTLARQAYSAGVDGTITASANIAPHWIQAVRSAVLIGQDASEPQAQLDALRGLLDHYPMRAATKFLLHRYAGLPVTAVRPPLVDLTQEQRSELETLAAKLKIET